MPLDYLNQVVQHIEGLDPTRDGGAFSQELVAASAPLLRAMPAMKAGVAEIILAGLGGVVITKLLAPIPAIAAELEATQQRSAVPEVLRCCVAGALVLVRQNRDVIDDHLPSGYGFVDAATLLHATYEELRRAVPALPAPNTEAENPVDEGLKACPRDCVGQMTELIEDVRWGFRVLGNVPEERLRATRERLLQRGEQESVRELFDGLLAGAGGAEGTAADEAGGEAARRIFISYRRADSSEWSERLYWSLNAALAKYGVRIFFDKPSIDPGQRFTKRIQAEIESADIVLAVIGPQWASTEDEEGNRRLTNRYDVLRREISYAFKQGVKVIPVLVGGAVMPGEEALPKPMKSLAGTNAVSIGIDSFDSDMVPLCRAMRELLVGIAEREEAEALECLQSLAQDDGEVTVLAVSPEAARAESLHAFPVYGRWACRIHGFATRDPLLDDSGRADLVFENYESDQFDATWKTGRRWLGLRRPKTKEIHGKSRLILSDDHQTLNLLLEGTRSDGKEIRLSIPIRERVGGGHRYTGRDDYGRTFVLTLEEAFHTGL